MARIGYNDKTPAVTYQIWSAVADPDAAPEVSLDMTPAQEKIKKINPQESIEYDVMIEETVSQSESMDALIHNQSWLTSTLNICEQSA